MNKVNGWRIVCSVFVFWLAAPIAAPAKTNLKKLANFDRANGGGPEAALLQATDGNFYGTTYYGGANLSDCDGYGCGTVFKIKPPGKLTALYSFCAQPDCTDGSEPSAGLIQGNDGNFYGTTEGGGLNGNYGTLFKITPTGKLTTVYSFCANIKNGVCLDGSYPTTTLVQAADGNFYGATRYGGTFGCCGTIFRITSKGKLTTLHSFDGTDGAWPVAGLVLAIDGNFYGATALGGSNDGCDAPYGCGTVFKFTRKGKLTKLYSFCSQGGIACTDGAEPSAGLVQTADGNFYGTTVLGGANSNGGTVFKITAEGKLTTLYSFCAQPGCADGSNPAAGSLVQAADGKLYGTTYYGGANNFFGGTVFKMNSGGKLTTLYSFCANVKNGVCLDGNGPVAGLVQATDGNFYGTTYHGGSCVNEGGCGTVFQITPKASIARIDLRPGP